MRNRKKIELGKTSYLLVTAASLSLFILIAFFSYSLYGSKATYSASESCDGWSDNDGICWVCYDCDGLTTNPRWKWAKKGDYPKCTIRSTYTNPSSCTANNPVDNYACYDCGSLTPRYRWSTSKPSGCSDVTSSFKTKSKCLAGNSDGAVSEVKRYKLTFNPNGGSVSPRFKSLKEGQVYGDLPIPTNDKNVFKGWYTSSSGGTKVDATTKMGSSDKTIYAQWTPASGDASVAACVASSGKYCWECANGTKYRILASNPDTNSCSYTTASNCGYECITPPDNSKCNVPEKEGQYCWDNGTSAANRYKISASQPNGHSPTSASNCGGSCYGICWRCQTADGYTPSYKWAAAKPHSWCTSTDIKKSDCVTYSLEFTQEINDYRCNKDTGEWVKISVCQPGNSSTFNGDIWCKLLGSNATVSKSILTSGDGCGDKPSDDTPDETPDNPSDPGYTPSDPGYTPSDPGASNGGGSNNGGSNNGGSNEGSSQEPTNPGIAFSDSINGDRCYNGSWIRIVNCQPRSVSGAQCKTKDGTLVKRSSLTVSYGCVEVSTPYTDVIDDYRCNKDTGKWIYISSCQSTDNIGAKCKTSDSTILRSSLTNGYGCNSSQPGGSNSGNSGVNNPQTGTTEIIVATLVAAVALFVSWYYFKKNKVIEG